MMSNNLAEQSSKNSIIISGIFLCIASGYLNAYTFIKCYHVLGGFMTATTIICFFDAAKNDFGWLAFFRFFSIVVAFIGGGCGMYVLQHLKHRKVDETSIFRKMLAMQAWIMTLAVASGIVCYIKDASDYDTFLFALVGVISFVMGFNHHHQSTKIGNITFKTHMMTGNVWTMLNEAIYFGYSVLKKQEQTITAQESLRKAMFILVIFAFFVIGAICGSIVTIRVSYLAILIPWFLFILAAIFCQKKFAI